MASFALASGTSAGKAEVRTAPGPGGNACAVADFVPARRRVRIIRRPENSVVARHDGTGGGVVRPAGDIVEAGPKQRA